MVAGQAETRPQQQPGNCWKHNSADPYAVRVGIEAFLASKNSHLPIRTHHSPKELHDSSNSQTGDSSFWNVLENYYSHATPTTFKLDSTYVCAFGPGQGLEEEGGFKLLTEKVRVATNHHSTTTTTNATTTTPKIKLLCAIYSHSNRRDEARAVALTWGHKCDGFLVFSNESIPQLGMIELQHQGRESYFNMWQKVRSIWAYIYRHYYCDDDGEFFDFVHLSGDDTYVIVENLRYFLQHIQTNVAGSGEQPPLHLGQWIRQKNTPYISGGPGYTINRAALKLFAATGALDTCHADREESFEDRLFSHCMQSLGIFPADSRDATTGEQLYHDCSPHHLFTSRSAVAGSRRGSFHSRAAAYWETLAFPGQSAPNTEAWRAVSSNGTKTVGPKHHLDSAGTYSVAFHNIFNPLYMARVHAIIYKGLCPRDSPLGRGLAFYT
jgi:hypothetical protein